MSIRVVCFQCGLQIREDPGDPSFPGAVSHDVCLKCAPDVRKLMDPNRLGESDEGTPKTPKTT